MSCVVHVTFQLTARRMDKQKKLVEMSLKRNPSKAKTVARLGLSDFSTGQRVIATVKKVSLRLCVEVKLTLGRSSHMDYSYRSKGARSAACAIDLK